MIDIGDNESVFIRSDADRLRFERSDRNVCVDAARDVRLLLMMTARPPPR